MRIKPLSEMKTNTYHKLIRTFAAVAAVVYSSWIVGYFVNSHVALYGTASELAVKGQSFASLFRTGDFIVSACILASALLLFVSRRIGQSLTIAMYMLFGVFTTLAAYFSLLCSPVLQQCEGGAVLSRTFIHTTFGLLAGICLFMAIIVEAQRRKRYKSLLIIGSIAWVCLGLLSVFLGFLVDTPAYQATLQRLYLLGASLFIFILPVLLTSQEKT